MQTVCQAALAEDVNLKKASYECLVNIMYLYYDKMEAYMKGGLYEVYRHWCSLFPW